MMVGAAINWAMSLRIGISRPALIQLIAAVCQTKNGRK